MTHSLTIQLRRDACDSPQTSSSTVEDVAAPKDTSPPPSGHPDGLVRVRSMRPVFSRRRVGRSISLHKKLSVAFNESGGEGCAVSRFGCLAGTIKWRFKVSGRERSIRVGVCELGCDVNCHAGLKPNSWRCVHHLFVFLVMRTS